MRDQTLDMFDDFCEQEIGEKLNRIIVKLKTNQKAGYTLLKKYKNFEVERGIAIPTIRLRFHYVNKHLKKFRIVLDDKDENRNILGKIHKHK